MNTDWVGLIDEWAGRFFQELDYEREASNAAVFRDQMAGLRGITVAEVYPGLTNHEVLTTAWVQGHSMPSLPSLLSEPFGSLKTSLATPNSTGKRSAAPCKCIQNSTRTACRAEHEQSSSLDLPSRIAIGTGAMRICCAVRLAHEASVGC